ncbi:50S ribosomal protein L7/L12 [Gemmata sp. G18]|uniref:Large ribosomal subunit protein bL12 n=1 Tax=Gemmata palustris TaxID=2822762 RepID=A0ABS5BS68_9BACT|nr:50S ribosomal protein L7/L12 [Gemmata palustris]MBP3956582.1 50S ribosomal protein L7/L12 [Gemmata palustris]
MASIAELGEQLAGLTLIQAVELKNLLKDKYGIEPAAGGVMMAAGPAVAPEAKKEEPTEFNVILESFADKVKTIKVVRELTGQGLGEAKATVEGAPKSIKENVDKKTAEDVKKKLEETGAKVTIKPAG